MPSKADEEHAGGGLPITADSNASPTYGTLDSSSAHFSSWGTIQFSNPRKRQQVIRGERACGTIDFAGGIAGPQFATITPQDVLVAIAFPPYSKPVVDVVMDAHVAGRRIIGITDSKASPLARYSIASLLVESDTASRFQPISSVIALVQALLMAVTEP